MMKNLTTHSGTEIHANGMMAMRMLQGGTALLALNGKRLARELLPDVVRMCEHCVSRMDILIASPAKAPTSLLGNFLLDLEAHGIDFRLISTEGDLCEEVLSYVQRHRGISCVMLDSEADEAFEPIEAMGCRLCHLHH